MSMDYKTQSISKIIVLRCSAPQLLQLLKSQVARWPYAGNHIETPALLVAQPGNQNGRANIELPDKLTIPVNANDC